MRFGLRRHRRRRPRISTARQRSEFRKIRLAQPDGPPTAPLEQVRAPSASIDASERTGAHLSVRLVMSAAVIVLLFSGLIVRLLVLQVKEGPSFYDQASATTTRQVAIDPERGKILARGGEALATNVATYQVLVDPTIVLPRPQVISALASLLDVSMAKMTAGIRAEEDQTGPYVSVPVQPGPAGVTPADVTYIAEHPSTFGSGVSVEPGYTRKYPYGALGSQLLGYLSELNVGKITGTTGLEAQYQNVLRGRPGIQTIYASPTNTYEGVASTTPPVAGDNVVLNLSVPIEETLTNALNAQVVKLRSGTATGTPEPAPWAAGIVMSTTGQVLAMTSLPGYDANSLVLPISNANYDAIIDTPKGETSPGLNYATYGESPPGSTFKLATGTAALDDGIISAGQYVDDSGLFTYGTQTYQDSEGESLGEVDMTSALSESSDYYFYNLGKLFWQQNPKTTPIQNTARAYGIAEPSGIDLASEEAVGQLDSPALRIAQHSEDPVAFPYNTYFGGDNVDLAIGQGETEVTPLEMADAYATFANHGTRYAPEMANEIVGPTGKVIKRIAPKVEGHVALPDSIWDPMDVGFEGAVNPSINPKGTAVGEFTGFDFNSWNLAGKTGTADITNNSSKPPTSWFVGFGGPKGSSTQYVVAICIYEAGFGAQGSAPVARTVFDYLAAHGVGPVKGH